jgi:hypothetical protein
MGDNLKFWSVVALLAAGVIALGWRQPLRYRFMSAREIAALESPPPPPPTPTPKPWMWDSNRSNKLDRRSYGEQGYSSDKRGRVFRD